MIVQIPCKYWSDYQVQDKKLRKDEKFELIRKLSKSKVDTSLLRSSRNLGTGREAKKVALSRASSESQAGDGVRLTGDKSASTLRGGDDDSDISEHLTDLESAPSPTDHVANPAVQTVPFTTVGSGLKRPLDLGVDGNPVIKRRKKKRLNDTETEPAWEGFSTASDDGGLDLHGLSHDESSDVPSDSESDNTSATNESATTEGDDDGSVSEVDIIQRSSAFKSWATQQVNHALGFTPTATTVDHHATPVTQSSIAFKPRASEQDPLPPELAPPTSTDVIREAFSVTVERSAEIQDARLKLPVVAEEQKIMEAIHNNPTVVIWGATGSGKTTQVP